MHSLNFNFVPFLRLHDGQAEGGRSTGADRWQKWASRRDGEGTELFQVRLDRACGQVGRRARGQEYGTGRRVEEADGDGRTKKGRCMRVACLVVAAQQQKLKLTCSYFTHVVV